MCHCKSNQRKLEKICIDFAIIWNDFAIWQNIGYLQLIWSSYLENTFKHSPQAVWKCLHVLNKRETLLNHNFLPLMIYESFYCYLILRWLTHFRMSGSSVKWSIYKTMIYKPKQTARYNCVYKIKIHIIKSQYMLWQNFETVCTSM